MDESPLIMVERIRLETIAEAQRETPANTKKAYKVGQKEFRAYCIEHPMGDEDTVSEAKLLAFMQTKVVNRPSKRQNTPGIIKTVGIPTINMYLASITSLWMEQCANKRNNHPNPRTTAIMKSILNINSIYYRLYTDSKSKRALASEV